MSRLSLLSPDAALVRQALADEPRAFETLVRRYQRQAHAIARAAGVRADSLEDVVQEAFLQAFRGLCNLRAPDSFGSWFLRIVRNLSLRDRHTRGPPVASGVVDPDSLAAPTSPVAEVYEERERLWRSVDRLPEGIREAIFLYYYEGQSTRRVARSLGVSRSAVKTRLKRGRDQLRERLWREFGSALRGDVPSAGEWRRQGRRMALLVIASANRDLAAASTVSVSGSGGGSFLGGSLSTAVTTGALIMKAKTVLIALTLASLALAGGWMALRDRDGSGPGGTRDLAGAGGSLAEPGPIATTSDPDELPAAPAVTGSPVTGISGLVVYEDSGLAVPGARVAATLKGASERASITSSGDDGAYLLTGLEPGEYRLWSWKEDWAIARPPDPVEVVKGEVTRDVHQVLAPGVVITGEVLEEASDRPIAGATVRFSELHYTFAGESGGFRLEGVPGGLHRLVARGAGFAPVWALADVAHGDNPFVRFALASGGVIEGTVFDPGGEPVEGAAVSGGTGSAETDGSGRYRLEGVPLHESSGPVSASIARSFVGVATFPGFEPGETRATLDLHLERGYVLAGRVVDPGGEPVPGVALHLHGSMIFSMPRATDADGRFAIEGASERMFFLGTRKKGFASSTTSLRDIPPEERESIEIALGPGHFVAGRVVDTSGEPLDDAWVNVEAKLQIPPAHVARTDEDGRFRIEDLPAELDTIGAGRPGYAGSMFNPVEADRDDIELVLEESGQIRGVVVDRETGEPVRPILVKVSIPDEARLRRENQLKKSRGGWLGPLDLGGSGSPGRVTVPLGGPGRLDVVVRDSTDGSPLESVRVMLGPRLPVPIRPNAMTDSRGRAVIESLPAGPYQLHVSGGERADVVELVEIPAGRIEKTIELGPASWMVVDLDVPPGYAKKHAVVALVVSGDDPGWPYRSREGDLPMASQGFAGKPMRIKVHPGAYRVRFEVKESYVNSPSLAVHEADVVVPAGGEAAVRVPLGG